MNQEIPHDPKSRFLDSLLNQEQPVSSSVYQEYQTMLDQKLKDAERKVRRSRIETAIIFGGAALCGAIGWYGERHSFPDSARLVMGCIGISGIVLAYWGVFRLFRYFVVDRRVVDQARDESRDAVLLELTRKVDALAQRFESLSAQK